MQYEKHAERLLRESDRLPAGTLRRELLDEAVRVARLSGDERLHYSARLRVVVASAQSGDTSELLDTIEWCLDTHLEDPERFPAAPQSFGGDVDLAEQFAAVPPALARSPRHSLELVDQALAELRQLLDERSGRAIETRAIEAGEIEARAIESGDCQREADILLAAARSETFEACGRAREASEQRARVLRLVEESDTGSAGHPLLQNRGAFTPARRIAESLAPLLDGGQLSDAYLEHLRGYELIREDSGQLSVLALHLRFLLESGSIERALLLVERHLDTIAWDPLDESGQFDVLIAIGELLDVVCETATVPAAGGGVRALGPGLRMLAAEHPALQAVLGELAAPVTAEALADACWAAAGRLAAAFDRRNGNTSFDDRLARAEARSDARCEALASHASHRSAPVPAPASGRAPASGTTLAHAAENSTAGRTSALDLALTPWFGEAQAALTSADWLRAARERASVEDRGGAEEALRRAHEELDREDAERGRVMQSSSRSLARPRARAQAQPPPQPQAQAQPQPQARARARARVQDQTHALPEPETSAATARTGPLEHADARWGTQPSRFDDLLSGATSAGNSSNNNAPHPLTRPPGNPPAAGATHPARLPGNPTTDARLALWDLGIRIAVEADDLTGAERLAACRIDLLETGGRQDQADAERELGLLLFGVAPQRREGDLERALDIVRDDGYGADVELGILNALGELRLRRRQPSEAIGYLLSSVGLCGHDPDSVAVQRPLALLAHAQVEAGQAIWARATLDRLLRHDLDRALRANALLMRARVLQQAADFRAAVEDADRALSLYLELRYSKGIIDACVALASLLEALGIRAGVAEAWRMAVAEAVRGSAPTGAGGNAEGQGGQHPELPALRFRLARALVAADRGEEAVAELTRMYRSLADAGGMGTPAGPAHTDEQPDRAEVLFWLGHAQRLSDDDAAAYATWSLALRLTSAARDARRAVRTGLALGRLLLDDDDTDSLDVLAHALDQARLVLDDPGPEIDTLHLLGVAQCAFGDTAGLATLDRSLDLASATAFDIDGILADITESRARAYDDLGLDTEALASAARAAWLYERLSDRASAGRAHLFTARLLVTLGRHEEALPLYRRCLDLLPADTPVVELAAQEWQSVHAGLAAIAAGKRPTPAVSV
ncbi:hypothetical protein B7R54_00415 [Subtercola boreus]|uniref:Tetratricopeptide repeat protein n=1 Tax=Subtercola boreus TaxID=120213 RepID=A0A3E0VE63_9MICO|nr:hypothetical protein [Subtercola boreus]RFA07843.1 hypothetical protein B7R54_00415 [Subtercola boreus]TQL55305.1 hypothetical protein FB464_2868 [Subtercola boreus]